MFGQRASSQIVCRLAPWISLRTSKYRESVLGALCEHDPERLLLVAQEVRRQHLHRRLRHLVLQRTNRGGVMARALVREIVAVD